MGNSETKDKEAGQIDYERLGTVAVKELDDPQGG